MTTSNSGAVFFLGTRAHYQVLTPPDSNNFEENGNTSTETIYQNHSTDQEIWRNNKDNNSDKFLYNGNTDSIIERKEFDYADGIKRRLKKNRQRDGSSELILNDNEENELNVTDLNDTDSENAKKNDKRTRVSVAYLLAILSRRKKTTSRERYLRHLESALHVCTFRDSCRCDECQSRYFDCDESDDDSPSEDEEYPTQYPSSEYPSNEYSGNDTGCCNGSADYACDDCGHARSPSVEEDGVGDGVGDGDKEVCAPQAPAPAAAAPAPAEEELMLEMAAGAPVFFNHLLNNPITCVVM